MSETVLGITVERIDRHNRPISIYDKLGVRGDISLTIDEAEFVKEALEEALDNE